MQTSITNGESVIRETAVTAVEESPFLECRRAKRKAVLHARLNALLSLHSNPLMTVSG